MKNIPVDYKHSLVGWWGNYASELMTEYQQSIEEGLDIAQYEELFAAVTRLPQDEVKKKLGDILFQIVHNAKMVEDYKYNEPSTLDEIRALRKNPAKAINWIQLARIKADGLRRKMQATLSYIHSQGNNHNKNHQGH